MIEAIDDLQVDIAHLQRMRRNGNEEFARDVANGIGAITEDIATLPPDTLKAYMQIWRIWVGTDLCLAQQTPNPEYAAILYQNAKQTINTYYDDKRVQEAASVIPEMAAEMHRDKGNYYLQVARVTGNATFLERAIVAFDAAVAGAEPGRSVQGLAKMDKYEARRRAECSRGDLTEYRRAFRQVVQSDTHQDDKRDASLRYAKESLTTGHPVAALHGAARFISYSKPPEIGRHIVREMRNQRNTRRQRRVFHSNPQAFAL